MTELSWYDYHLPKGLIAQHPLVRRTDARLLVVDRGSQSLAHHHIRDLPSLLRPGDCLVVNDTQVVPARLVGHRTQTGGRWEGLFLSSDDQGRWRLLCKVRGNLTPGESVRLHDLSGRDSIELQLLDKLAGGVWLAQPNPAVDSNTILNQVGHVPLPHYLHRPEEAAADRVRYQTVYARHPGAVAAPTAGLHFTQELLDELTDRGVVLARVTLHVGLDTFQPIKVASLAQHAMHSEQGELLAADAQRINDCRARGGRVVAVGTTTVRVLETAGPMNWPTTNTVRPWQGTTDLFIRPPYQFRAVDALLTNFHLPRTTLLVLVRTFGGDELIMRAYEEAIRQEYRFYSYGDAMLIL